MRNLLSCLFFCCHGNVKAMHSLRMASAWRMVPVPAGRTGWRSTSWGWKMPCCLRTDWRGSSSAACRGLTTERDFFTTRTLTRKARVMVSLEKTHFTASSWKCSSFSLLWPEDSLSFRHRDLHQPPPEALLPCFRDVSVGGHPVCWIPRPPQMDERSWGGQRAVFTAPKTGAAKRCACVCGHSGRI